MNSNNFIDAKTNFTIWRVCAWAGPIYLAGLMISWAVVGKFFPPPLESWSTDQLVSFYTQYNLQIRAGMVGAAFFGAFLLVWSCIISKIIQRIEGPNGILSNIELIGGALTTMVIMCFSVSWLTASFRPGVRTPQDIQLLQDMGWMYFDMTFMVTVFQMFAFGTAIIIDKRAEPLFPNWLGWLSFAGALAFLPVLLMPFFTEGPFAWHGLLSYYVALIPWFVWAIIANFCIFKAINKIERESEAELIV